MNNTTNWPKITVVTPSYNQGSYLEETILSVLDQGYPNLEYIVIDGASADNSLEVIKRYADRLDYWVSEPDKGQADAINKGFRHSNGDIMGWLNSDDILLPNALFKIASAFNRSSNPHVVTGLRKIYDPESNFVRNMFDCIPTKPILRLRCSVYQETTYWRRGVWEQVGELNSSLNYALDFEYWQRILDAGYAFTLIPEYLGGFRVHPDSKGETMNHVRDEELTALYQSRGIADDEADATRKLAHVLGNDWQTKLYLIHRITQKPISNNPRVPVWLARALQTPLLSQAFLTAYKLIGK